MTSKELRAAMEGVDSEESEVLVAAVRELYEALYNICEDQDDEMTWGAIEHGNDIVNRYRAALQEARDE